jgi:hypothetical protein
VLDGVAWQPLGIVCPTWNGEGRTAEVARAVGKGVGRRVEGRRRAAGRRSWPGRGGGVQQRRSRGMGTGEGEGDPVVKSKKLRDLSVMHI